MVQTFKNQSFYLDPGPLKNAIVSIFIPTKNDISQGS